MDRRIAKVNISSPGGTAGAGARTCKVTLPTSWLDAMGITEADREVELFFDGHHITISRCLGCEEFAAQGLSMGHTVRRLRFYDRDTLCTTIYADFTAQAIQAENHISDPVKTAFGNDSLPSWEGFQAFLEDRCIPRQRTGLREYLEALGLEGYDPLAIIAKTGGRMAEDQQWLDMEVLS